MVAKQTEAGLSVMKRLSSFMEGYVAAHDKFITEVEASAQREKAKLTAMNPKTGVDNMDGTFLSVMDFFDQVEKLMRTYRNFNEILAGNCVDPLVTYTDVTAKRRMELQGQLNKAEQERQQNQLRVNKQRATCAKLISALNEKKTTHFETKEKEKEKEKLGVAPAPKGMIGKLKMGMAQGMSHTTKSTGKAMDKAREKARMACIQYKEQVTKAEEFQKQQDEKEFPQLVFAMGDSEALRVDQIAYTLNKFQQLTIDFAQHFKVAAEALSDSRRELPDSKKDIPTFVSKCLQKHGPPKPSIPFEYDLAFDPDDLTTENFTPSLFSSSLEAVLSYEQNMFPEMVLEVPRVLDVLIQSVQQNGGTASEGIFRLSTSSERLGLLRKQLEAGNYDIQNTGDPNPPAALLKAWLRDLAEPVIPTSAYQDCVTLGRKEQRTVEEIKQALGSLPDLNRRVLARVFRLCSLINDNSEATRMTFSNLAIVFSPGLLQSPNLDPMQQLQDAKYATVFVEDIMVHRTELFGEA
eukprot:gb/GEZN01006251.1/.p1 GENE.gb/GEZN01006251.1/~~gb/GEZN01006251.1/.p1  ORF type:complete len:558 (-),score=129.10 gb/GEZN01006251.1/:17-1579(-)